MPNSPFVLLNDIVTKMLARRGRLPTWKGTNDCALILNFIDGWFSKRNCYWFENTTRAEGNIFEIPLIKAYDLISKTVITINCAKCQLDRTNHILTLDVSSFHMIYNGENYVIPKKKSMNDSCRKLLYESELWRAKNDSTFMKKKCAAIDKMSKF